MSTFLGIGLGPIQTGIFLDGAARGGCRRLVVAEIDAGLCAAVARAGCLRINVAHADRVETREIAGVEVFNPNEASGRAALIAVAAEADEVATALPQVGAFAGIAPWLGEGLRREPRRRRFIYAAENHNHAAALLAAAVGGGDDLPATHFLDTVIGKMSGVLSATECAERGLSPLAADADRGHLVEEFDRNLVSACADIAERRVTGLSPKPDLYPFEEAKLFGHNAIHLLLGLHARAAGKAVMGELRDCPEIMAIGRAAFLAECGTALCRKWSGTDELFTSAGWAHYAEDLLVRMVNPFLEDRIERVCRDLPRKLGWDDRLIGAMRLALAQLVPPCRLAGAAAMGAAATFGDDREIMRREIAGRWPSPWGDEHEQVWRQMMDGG